MEYTIQQLSELAGVSARTLRYYDQIGLLKPKHVNLSGYRVYGSEEVDRLQQILYLRVLGVRLSDMKRMLDDPHYDRQRAFEAHLEALERERDRLDRLILSVKETMQALKGGKTMSDSEKFAAFREERIAQNEALYGREIREKYGDDVIDACNEKMRSAKRSDYEREKVLEEQIAQLLREAIKTNDPAGEVAQRMCELHRQWLCCFWTTYSPQMHRGVAELYVQDPRFERYYEQIVPGGAAFLRDAIAVYTKE